MPSYTVSMDGTALGTATGGDGVVRVGETECRVVPLGVYEFAVVIGDRTIRVAAAEVNGRVQLAVNGCNTEATVVSSREAALREYSARSGAAAGPADVRAPMPALVVRVEVAPGDPVRKGQGLIVLEAMKMENEITSTHDGVVREILVAKGATVEKNQLLLRLEEGSGS